jgi:competence ComEA-like helix-hairpin-helix protein
MVSRLLAALLGVFLLAPVCAAAQAPPPAIEKAGPTVNLNTASAADLQNLPGIGAKMAERILEYRQKNGPFKKIEEILENRSLGLCLLRIRHVGYPGLSPEVAENLRKSRDDSRVVGAVVGALA